LAGKPVGINRFSPLHTGTTSPAGMWSKKWQCQRPCQIYKWIFLLERAKNFNVEKYVTTCSWPSDVAQRIAKVDG